MRWAIALCLCATTALAQGEPPRVHVIVMTQAIERAGCVLNLDNAEAVQADADLSEDEMIAVFSHMFAQGTLLFEEDGSARLINDSCP